MRNTSLLLAAGTFAVVSLSAVPCFADRAAADKCAAGLSAESKLIYADSIGSVAPGVNLRDIVRSKTRSLVFAGKVGRSGAQAAAEAAGTCLVKAM
ncbi:MAG TPA: hypothetical protein VG986_18100 [Pseudolabrys sp.]|nr:hypothetical protein [Pseudolabrys sp.]